MADDDDVGVWDEQDAPVFSGLSPRSVHRVSAAIVHTQTRTVASDVRTITMTTTTTAATSTAATTTATTTTVDVAASLVAPSSAATAAGGSAPPTTATVVAIDMDNDDGVEERAALLREEPSPSPPQQQQQLRVPRASQQSRTERNSSSGDGGSSPGGDAIASSTSPSNRAAAADLDWGVEDDGWMPKPARLHAGKTRSCTACFAPLQYTTAPSWDEYLQSDEYLRRLQDNLLDDTFISGLICGDSTGGDLPTEHRMHKNRKMKCRQSVHDHLNMVSAGVVDKGGKEKGSVRTLEEMLLTVLPTPLFTHVLERRLAVISHSSRIASALLKQSHVQRVARPLDASGANVELHHLAVHTLSALLASFDYSSTHAQQAFEEMARLLACFPVLSLYAFWSPTKKHPERALALRGDMVDATSCAASPKAHPAELAVDDSDATYWLSQQRPGLTHFVIRHAEIGRVASIQIRWHAKSVPQKVAIEYRVAGTDTFVAVTEEKTTAVRPPEYFSVRFPENSTEMRVAMSGVPPINRNGTYAIENIRLNVPCANSLFIEPRAALNDVARWLLGALHHGDEDIVVEAIGALKAWALATASLSTTLLFVKMLLDLGDSHCASSALPSPSVTEPSVTRFALDQGRQLFEGVCAYKTDECDKVLRGEGKKRNSESRKVRAVFEPSVCSSGVTIEDAGVTVRTRETSYQYAAVNTGISTGKASWKFRLDNDTVDDEMTCFGAAILPVTVSGYDSSPSLWMLRGYNGNLYARGHKLSRSIGKVHPGDVVQIEVDMTEGTLAYTINETEYGVVFTDLAGHEVFPAVSFYGSGKVITLLGVQKWDDSDAGAGGIEPVYLSNLKEYHYAVGYGTFGKGNQLGYASDADARTLSSGTASGANNPVTINGEPRQRCLSTHPPSRGDAYVIYDLGEAFDRLVGAVGINDDVENEMLQQRGVAVAFSIVGDGKPLWHSKAVSEARQVEKFDLSVRGVRMLELLVTCAGSNHCAHAIWIDPCVYPLDEWTCSACTFMNKGASKRCSVCRRGTRDASTSSSGGSTVPTTVAGVSVSDATLHAGDNELVPLDPTAAPKHTAADPFLELSVAITNELFELAALTSKRERLKARNAVSDRTGNTSSTGSTGVGFEEPFCRQPCGAVFSLLLDMLRRFQTDLVGCGSAATDSRTQLAQRLCISTLGIVSVNFESIAVYDVGDLTDEIGLSKVLADELRHELECIASIDGDDPSDGGGSERALPNDVQIAASETIIAGISVIYSSPSEKLQLLLHLLRRHASVAFRVGTSRYVLLSALMRLLASPGQEGILNLFPFVGLTAPAAVDSASSVDASSLAAVKEAIRLLIRVIQQSSWTTRAPSDNDSSTVTGGGDDCIASDAMALLKTYQLFLLAEAVGLTKTARAGASVSDALTTVSEPDAKRQLVQESTIQYGFLLLRACRELVEALITEQTDNAFALTPAECALRANLRTFETPVLSELLPWFVSCLCLLRRQTWLARPILPALCRLLGSVDQYCAALPLVDRAHSRLQKLELHETARQIEVQELERMLAVDKSLVVHPTTQTSATMYNVFKQLYTGDKDHFEGQIGFQFEATSTFAVVALGRSVNPSKNSGRLVRQHAVRLWDEASQLLVAHVVVSGASKKDSLGYALEPLATPVKLTQGKLYRLTTHEYANGGDPWYKKENLPDEEYDSSYIKILRDCYASGSTAFPNSQNLSGAAYGVPTFLVEGENPIASLPRFATPFGSLAVQFNTKRKLASVHVSHSGTSAHGVGSASWRSCFLQRAFVQGVHAVDFIVKSARVGGIVSGHICVGVDWSLCTAASTSTAPTSAQYESFFGETRSSVGWMPAIGALWVKGERACYGPRVALVAGDILTLVVDYDLHTLSFAHNGKSVGVAVGLAELRPASTALTQLPAALTPGVSIYGSQDVVQIRPSGIAKSTLRVHWLFDLHNSLASLAGRIASTLIAGHPVDGIEEELLPWLQSPLLSGGILSDNTATVASQRESGGGSATSASLLDWRSALEAEYAKHPSDAAFRGLLLREQGSKNSAAAGFPLKRGAGSNAALLNDDLYTIRQSKFFESLSQDMSDTGPVQIVLNWLDKRSPDRSFLSRFGRFPQCERLMCAALIKHAPPHVLHEAQAIVSGATTAADPAGRADSDVSSSLQAPPLDHSDLDPSEDLLLVWKRVVTLRHWLIKTRQEYRTRSQDEASVDRSSSSEPPVSDAGTSSSSSPPDELAFEKRLALPKSFDEFVTHVCQRAEFLCLLDPPSEERDKLGVDSQVALSNLAEKWSAQKTPPALQPMLERWKSLREADSSKWSGIVDVLRAQDRWRTRRASVTGAAVGSMSTEQLATATAAAAAAATGTATGGLNALDEHDDTTTPKRRSNYKDSFSATIKACDLYIRNGVGAPPEVLRSLLERRQKRSDSRLFGLQAMASVLNIVSFDSARHNAIIFLRPALRGFTDDERESRELNDGQVVTETFRATVRHHYLKGLEGCNRPTIERVQQAFCDLYAFLAQLLSANCGAQLQHAVLCAWSLDFEARDHPFLLKTGIFSTLHDLFSIQSSQRDAVADLAGLRVTAKAYFGLTRAPVVAPLSPPSSLQYTTINWHPLSEDFVQQSVLHTGYVTKRDILRLLLRAPAYACSRQWWIDSGLDAAFADDSDRSASPTAPAAAAVRHTASSMSLLYAELLQNLQTKLAWCCPHLLGRKALQLSMSHTSSYVHGTSASAAKPLGVSYVETPALGEVQDFCLEMWVYPVELSGYRSLRSDNGFQDGSVFVEFVDQHLQVGISGHFPREQRFTAHRFRAHEWVHVALSYSSDVKRLVLAVNGAAVDARCYERVGRAIHFRAGRLGCWVSDADAHGVTAATASPQRSFQGAIAEVRVWRVARSVAQIARDYQRSVPFDVVDAASCDNNGGGDDSSHSNTLLALWHLDEGEGLCGSDSAPLLGHHESRASMRESAAAGKTANLTACHWALMNVPVASSPIIDALDATTWTAVLRGIVVLQRRLRRLVRERYQAAVLSSRLVCQYEETQSSQQHWGEMSDDSDNDGGESDCDDSDDAAALSGGSSATRTNANPLLALDRDAQALVKEWSVSTDQQILLRKQTKKCAWIVFRFLATIGVGGVHDRREDEAATVAALAKLKRRQKLHKGESIAELGSPMHQRQQHGKSDAARAAGLSYDEEEQHARSLEAASDAAKSAATNRELAEPVLQTLWFSQEVQRKVFEVIEKELVLAAALIQDAEGLTRAQRMLRSISTPVQRRGASLRTHGSGVDVSGGGGGGGVGGRNVLRARRPRLPSELAAQGELMETLEVEMSTFALLSFMLSLSASAPALQHLAKSKTLRELLELQRTASPRAQRVVKLLLRRVCCSGIVTPTHVSALLGSESVFVDLLLDQVAESVCSTAAPLSTHSVGTPASSASSGESSTTALIAESLANPMGFRSGQIYLVLASESVALLRLLLKDKRWQSRVAELLCSAIRNVAPVLTRRKSDSSAPGGNNVEPSDIRVRAAIVRAVGALCVLGSHSDCLRIGGRVEVTAKGSRADEPYLDYGFHLSDSGGATPAPATLIELNSRTSTVRVVFDASSEDVDPGHNAQEVALSSLAPVEEIRLPSDVIPLTLDMMPVILKLASLEESSVMASFDDLWRMQVRSRALLALEAILRHSVHMAQDVAHRHVTASLLSTALAPVRLNTFVSLPCLQERGRMILCRLIESSTPLGSAMFRGLGDPKPPAIVDDAAAASSAAAAACSTGIANSDPEEEETEEFRVRRGFASNIAAMGFAFDLCMAALEHCRDDPNLAVDWLMGAGAIAYQEQKQTQRLAAARLATHHHDSASPSSDGVLTLDAKAQELESISGMPLRLVRCALELSSNDPNRAMEWLMEHGTRYIETTECLALLADDFVTEQTLALDDHAAMEDVDQPDPLVTLSSTKATAIGTSATAASGASGVSTAMTSVSQPVGDNSDIMAVTLAPILAPAVEKSSTSTSTSARKKAKGTGRDASALGFAPLDPNYLTPHVLLSVSAAVGPLPSLAASGRTGVFRRYTREQGVLITFLNTETGAYEDEWHLPQDVRRITRIYDEAVESVSSIHRVALRTENALATHYARRAIAALLDAGSAVPLGHDVATATIATGTTDSDTAASSSEAVNSFADVTLRAVGGPRQFVNLLKLVAASEMVFSRGHDAAHVPVEAATASMAAMAKTTHQRRRVRGTSDSVSCALSGRVRPPSDESGSILQVVRQITLDVLDEEARCGKVQDADWLWHSDDGGGTVAHGASDGSDAVRSPSTAIKDEDSALSDAVESMMLDEFGELDEDLYRAIAMSVQDAQSLLAPPAPVRFARRSSAECDEETKGNDAGDAAMHVHDAVPMLPRAVGRLARRVRQPSYAEAQEVASEYLGGSVDDHDGLLSSVLVKECVSHFVESTRVAGEGGLVTSAPHDPRLAPQEFQSLHPYFGRCDYTQGVAVDSAFRCMRVVFDHRCRLGAKTKLSFYSDAAREHRVLLVDASATAGGKRVPDLIVHGHQLWFRFVAAEDDTVMSKAHGYGYRFQVKAMPSICWSKEDEVLAHPSLEWACWLLELLLNDASELVARGAVHNRKIYGALVRYLRSPGAPFKSRVVRLLLQLLHRPTLFPAAEVPDLEALEAIGQLALARGKTEKDAGKLFISAHLLQLVELATMTSAAARVFAQTTAAAGTPSSPSCAPRDASNSITAPLLLPASVDQRDIADVLNDVHTLTKFLLGETRALPQHVLVAIWLDTYGSTGVVESAHPYAAHSEQCGLFRFPGAQSLLVTFDPRCATASDAAVLELSSRSSASVSAGATAAAAPLALKRFSGAHHWPTGAVDFPGDELTFRFDGSDDNVGGTYGVSFSVLAIGLSREKQLARASVEQLEALLAKLQASQTSAQNATDTNASGTRAWTSAMDLQLVDWVNNKIESAASATLGSVDLRPSDVRLHPTLDGLRCSLLLDVPRDAVALRFALLKYLNQCLKECVALLDLRDTTSAWTLAHRLRRLSHCVFFDLKHALVEAAIDATSVLGDPANSTANTARITLDRLQALESRDDREVEPSVSECFFAQAFRQLQSVDPTQFRRKIDSKGRLFSVKFRGEEGVDWGGVYREGANSMVDDLFSPHFSLFVLCPNGQHDTGTNRGMYLPNPKCTSPVAIQMYEFVGKLLGISLRTHGDFPFAFPSLVWKQLLRAPLEQSDLEGTDAMLVQMLDGIRNCERDGIVTADEFDAAFQGLDLRFTAFDCNGHEVELVDGGRTLRVTFANRLEYCVLAEQYRLFEGAVQVAAMVRGFATVFPLRALTLLTWQEMEILTCGTPKIDLALWQQHTRYDGYNENDDAVQLFWQAMASFSDEQRSDFVRFAWGRSRLPRGKWPQPFKLTKKGGRDATLSLPVAHTCFFSVELPPYTTMDKMRSMLLATINFGLGGILMA